MNDGQQQANEELHRRTIEALKKAAPFINTEDLALICWHCGIQPAEVSDFYEPQQLAA